MKHTIWRSDRKFPICDSNGSFNYDDYDDDDDGNNERNLSIRYSFIRVNSTLSWTICAWRTSSIISLGPERNNGEPQNGKHGEHPFLHLQVNLVVSTLSRFSKRTLLTDKWMKCRWYLTIHLRFHLQTDRRRCEYGKCVANPNGSSTCSRFRSSGPKSDRSNDSKCRPHRSLRPALGSIGHVSKVYDRSIVYMNSLLIYGE